MKAINFKPTSLIVFDQNTQFDDNTSTFIQQILESWIKNHPKCAIKLERDSSDSSSKTTLFFSKECRSQLYDILKPYAQNKDIEMSEIIDGYKVKYIKQAAPIKIDKKQEVTTNTTTQKPEGEIDYDPYQAVVQGLKPVLDMASSTAFKAMGITSSYKHDEDKQLIEEIRRIKKLLK